jgi:hypothetical protein
LFEPLRSVDKTVTSRASYASKAVPFLFDSPVANKLQFPSHVPLVQLSAGLGVWASKLRDGTTCVRLGDGKSVMSRAFVVVDDEGAYSDRSLTSPSLVLSCSERVSPRGLVRVRPRPVAN